MPGGFNMDAIKDRLIARREEIRGERREIDRRRKELHEPEVEMEEQAQKEKMALKLEQQDQRTRDELKLVNDALVRMEAGTWGMCETCGEDIDPQRLEAIPWTKTCLGCAGTGAAAGPAQPVSVEPLAAPLPPDYQGMSDEQLAGAVLQELRNDGRVELDDLAVTARDGLVALSGDISGNRAHEVLMEVVQDVMGLTVIEDNTRVSRQAFPAKAGISASNPTDVRTVMEGEPVQDDPWASRREGEPTSPSDRMVRGKNDK